MSPVAPILRRIDKSGLPPSLRGIIWQVLSGAHIQGWRLSYAPAGLYARLVAADDATCVWSDAILRDVHRTFPSHRFMRDRGGRGQAALYHVLKAYALFDREVGYCQVSDERRDCVHMLRALHLLSHSPSLFLPLRTSLCL